MSILPMPPLHNPLDVPLALLAGIFTVASPCVLPVLPVILSSSVAGARRRARPLFVVAGFVITFAFVGMLLGTASSALHIAQTALRHGALAVLALSGLLRLWPRPYDWLVMQLRPLFARSRTAPPMPVRTDEGGTEHGGNGAGFLLGMSLGAVWTPCAGPVLASILVLVVKAQDPVWSALLVICYAIGAAIPMLAIIHGGGYATRHVRLVARYTERLQQVFGVLVLLTALAIYFQYDIVIYARIAAFLPNLKGF